MKKLSIKEDWPLMGILIFSSIGLILPFVDFIFFQQSQFQFNFYFYLGIVIFLIGEIMEIIIRIRLKNAGFKTILATVKLQIVENHKLVTDGFFKYIRHPMYLSGILQIIGWALLFNSFISFIAMVIAFFFIIPRIQIEEKMLLEKFGNEYAEYMKKTKKVIPFIY